MRESIQHEDNPEKSLRIHEALRIEYRDMASWYDRFWGDYLNKTLELPMQLIRETMHQLQKSRNELKIVDIGCGTGEFLKRLITAFASYEGSEFMAEKACEFCGVDPSQEMLEQAKKKCLEYQGAKVEFLPGQAESLPMADSSSDIVCSTSALHFFGEKKRALEEMYRVLKPHGSLIITDWCADYLLVRLYHFVEYLRWNIFHRYDERYPGPLGSHRLLELVSNAGFYNIRVHTYRVRIFVVFQWGMQTVTASKP